MKFLFIHFIKGYRFLISPLIGQNCRFYPTCSVYAIEAIERYGVIKGSWLGLKRIGKCQPYYKGDMIDPVPTCSKQPCAPCVTKDDQL